MPPLRSAVAELPAHRRHQHIHNCHSHSSQHSNLMDQALLFGLFQTGTPGHLKWLFCCLQASESVESLETQAKL